MDLAITRKSLQEILDQSVDHLFAHATPSCGPSGHVAYRTVHGAGCVVGRWIPPEQYRREWDEHPSGIVLCVNSLIKDPAEGAHFAAALAANGIDVHAPHVADLLTLLQRIYDRSHRYWYVDHEGKLHRFTTREQCLDDQLAYYVRRLPTSTLTYRRRLPRTR